MGNDTTDDRVESGAFQGWFAIGMPVRLAAAAAVIAGLTLAALLPTSPPALVPRLVEPPRPALVGLAPLSLAEPGIDPVRIEPGRLDPKSGQREDVLGRGGFGAIEAPVLRLALTRGDGAERAPGLFVLLARRAAWAARGELPLAVLRTGSRSVVATRFGPAETVEATLAGPVTRHCTGFVVAQPNLRIDGFLCAPLGGAPEARAMACTLDALDLDDPGDPSATAAFKRSRAPSACDGLGTATVDQPGRTGSIARRGADTKN